MATNDSENSMVSEKKCLVSVRTHTVFYNLQLLIHVDSVRLEKPM
jgi:hypothetical protein